VAFSTYIHRLFITLPLLLVHHISFAEDYENCDSEEIKIVYINGIMSDEEGTKDSMNALMWEVFKEFIDLGINIRCIEYDYLHNPSERIFTDLTESYAGGLMNGDNDWTGFGGLIINTIDLTEDIYESLNIILSPTSILNAKSIIEDKFVSIGEASLQIDENVSMFKSKIFDDLNNNRKVILVSHSQGNFFANALYDDITEQFNVSDNLHVVSVATPAGRVAGLDAQPELWTTNTLDVIQYVVGSKYPNVNTDFCGDIICHGFIATYLSEDNLRQSIIDNIRIRLGYTQSVAPYFELISVNAPDVFPLSQTTPFSISWSGNPTFPLTWSANTRNGIFTTDDVILVEGENSISLTYQCDDQPSSNSIETVLVDANGLQAQILHTFVCGTEEPVCPNGCVFETGL